MRTNQHTGGAGIVSRIPNNIIRGGVINREAMYRQLVDNGSLREDETRQIDEALVRVARRDLIAVGDLRAAGLIYPLNNIGKTTYEYDRVTPVGKAKQSMSILSLGDRDLVSFSRASVPIPVTASQFMLDARHRAAGTTMGQPVDLTNLEEHTRSVAEGMEDTLTNGSDEITLNGQALYGYTNFPDRHELSYSDTEWDQISGDPQAAVTDVLAARTALRDDGFTGPYVVYVPSNYDGVLEEDYKAFSERTLRERLLQIDGIAAVKVLPALPSSVVLVVQMTSSVVQWADAQDITTVTWDLYGGLATEWAVLNVGAPALKTAFARAPLSQGVLPPLVQSSGIAMIA
jgi:uncharacterized linocin/CFP29 family protein